MGGVVHEQLGTQPEGLSGWSVVKKVGALLEERLECCVTGTYMQGSSKQ